MKPEIKDIKDIDITEVIEICKSEIDSIENGTYHEDNDNAHYIYESIMEAIYGESVWDYINSNT